MKIYYDKDVQAAYLQGLKVAVIGFGSQGHAHALNLHDSGVDVIVGLRETSSSRQSVSEAGLLCTTPAEAAAQSDVLMLLAPDENQAEIYVDDLAPNLRHGTTLGFAHGFNIHFSMIEPRADLDVFMVAPKAPGHLVRSTYLKGQGVPVLIAIANNVSGRAHDLALAYAGAIGGGRAAIIETTFREETETDLFGEQAVLCGGVTALIEAGFDTLVENGYAPEMAYFECLHELKLIVDLIYEGGIPNMRYSVSNTAEYGDISRGPRVINQAVREEMKNILSEVRSGKFAKEFVAESRAGAQAMKAARQEASASEIEKTGRRLRAMMPWISANRLVKN